MSNLSAHCWTESGAFCRQGFHSEQVHCCTIWAGESWMSTRHTASTRILSCNSGRHQIKKYLWNPDRRRNCDSFIHSSILFSSRETLERQRRLLWVVRRIVEKIWRQQLTMNLRTVNWREEVKKGPWASLQNHSSPSTQLVSKTRSLTACKLAA